MAGGVAGGGYADRVIAALKSIREDEILAFVELLVEVRARGGRVFIVGNGGSATTASHMATDLGVGSLRVEAGVRAFSLTDNSGVITATGNDLSFEDIYAAQLLLLGERGDVLVAISASGNSPNLIEAALRAKQVGMKVVGLTGFAGGRLKDIADVSVHVETENGDYGPAEDAHLVVNHMVTEILRQRIGTASDTRNLHG